MTLINYDEIYFLTIKNIAQKMLIAAKTAPKAKGKDNTKMLLIEGTDIDFIASKMKEIGDKCNHAIFHRDAECITKSPILFVAACKISPMYLKKCGMCGFENCKEKEKNNNIPCVFNTGDLGIAIGSAVSIAMDHRVDNRILYTAGQAIIEMNLIGKEYKIIYVIPLSGSAKNPFFDR